MNTLSYGLLSLLSLSPSSGYDLMLRLQLFWPANHSQIYPLLAKLEELGYAQFDVVPQSDKPDKKVYAITDAGKAVLKEWISAPTAHWLNKDELALKTVCIGLSDPAEGRRMFMGRRRMYADKLEELKKKQEVLKEQYGVEGADFGFHSPGFGVYVLVERAVSTTRVNLDWCDWVMGLIAGEGR